KIIKKGIDEDNQILTINTHVKLDGSTAIISGTIIANTEVQKVLVGKLQLPTLAGGIFEFKEYIPRSGKTIEIVAYDIKGNKASKLLNIERGNIQKASGPKFDALNPSTKKVKPKPNALALIIGVANYEKTSANALYADKDAQQFYDYATMKLGISPSNIKELVNDKADRVEIGLAIQDWIARSTKSGKTDIYLFFAGHGLASQDGNNMFLLPYDGSPRLLSASAIKRKELFDNIQQANPRSVTVFLDTCYSGTTRGTDMLIASRPIFIAAKEQSIPDNFTVFSAAAGDQTSKPLEEAKHGMFSFFLMKGMEGDADANNDNKITARELHVYVEQNVVQQSSGSQTPELQGDEDRVLVHFN
ncbi:caspase family protein, partial [Alphaproteobacteria bacterium]|nr:caspase family protein [Alphaproteobacteria bacterium]